MRVMAVLPQRIKRILELLGEGDVCDACAGTCTALAVGSTVGGVALVAAAVAMIVVAAR
jgi:hypothetical protein